MTHPQNEFIELNAQLDEILASNSGLQSALNSDNPLIRAAARLTANNHPALSMGVRQAIWSAMSQSVLQTASTSPKVVRPNFSAWAGRVAAIIVIALMVGLAAQPASAGSIPGDFLYPVKLNFEQLALNLANSPESQLELHLDQAQERLNEIGQLTPDSPFIGETLESASNSLQAASEIASEHNIFGQDIAALEETQSIATHIQMILSSNPVPADVVNLVQTNLETVNAQLPVAANNQDEPAPEPSNLAPEATETAPDVTPVPSEDSPAADEQVDSVPVEPFTMYIYFDGRVNVRNGAGTSFDIIGTANQNTPVTVISQNAAGDWFEVRLPNGLSGWVWTGLLDDTPGNSGSGNGNSNGNAIGNANGNANVNAAGSANANAVGNPGSGTAGAASGNANGNSSSNASGNRNGRGN